MNLVVLTPEKEIFAGSIKSVQVPGTTGRFEILKGHAAIVSSLRDGNISITDSKGLKINYSIEKGFIEVLNNEVSLLVQGLQEL